MHAELCLNCGCTLKSAARNHTQSKDVSGCVRAHVHICVIMLSRHSGCNYGLTEQRTGKSQVASIFDKLFSFSCFFFLPSVRQMAPVILSSLGFLDCSPLVFPTSPCWLDCTLQLLDSKTCEWAKASLSFIGSTGRSGGGGLGRFLLSAQCLTFLLWHKRSAYGALKIRYFFFLLNLAGSSAGTSRK